MAVSPPMVRTWAIELLQKAKCSNGRAHNLFMVPAKFSFIRYINDPRIMAGSGCSAEDTITPDRTANAVFEEKVLSGGGFAWHEASAIRECKKSALVRN